MIKKLFTIKNLVILIITLSLSANIFYFGREAIRKEKQKIFNQGVIQITNQFYKAAETGELRISNFLLDKNNKIIIENGQPKMGEEIILEVKK